MPAHGPWTALLVDGRVRHPGRITVHVRSRVRRAAVLRFLTRHADAVWSP